MVEDLLQEQAGNHLWTLLDLEDGFHQMPLWERMQALNRLLQPRRDI